MTLKTTSLHEEHRQLKALMGPFAGFDMPIQYSSIKEEVSKVRTETGIFDVSHMGEFIVTGKGATNFVDSLLPNSFWKVPDRRAMYSPLCRDNGTIIDDLIAYKLSSDKILICVNASNILKDWEWITSALQKNKSHFDCSIKNVSDDYSLIALQGPKSFSILNKVNLILDSDFPKNSVREIKYESNPIIVARTGYTGEDGVEIFGDHKTIKTLWKKFSALGVTPCGLASRNVLRLEACYPLYGHELSDEITPLDCALDWTVKLDGPDFIGKSALSSYTPRYKLIKLSLDKAIPRDDYSVHNAKGDCIGKITSGTMSVTLGKGIALALININQLPEDDLYFIQIRNNKFQANIHKKPFVAGGQK